MTTLHRRPPGDYVATPFWLAMVLLGLAIVALNLLWLGVPPLDFDFDWTLAHRVIGAGVWLLGIGALFLHGASSQKRASRLVKRSLVLGLVVWLVAVVGVGVFDPINQPLLHGFYEVVFLSSWASMAGGFYLILSGGGSLLRQSWPRKANSAAYSASCLASRRVSGH